MSALEAVVASMTLAELARLANTSVERIVAAAMGSPSSAPSRSSRSKGSGRAASPATGANGAPRPARSSASVPRGSVSVAQVLKVLSGSKKPIDINAIRAKIGGSPHQVRAALKKLSTAGQVQISGERRATRYAVR